MSKTTNNKLPHTGNKAFDVIIVIILAISAIAIIAFAYSFVCNIFGGKFLGAFGNAMFALMYYSIAQYTIKYFIQEKAASIYDMLFSYCILTTITTLTVQNINEYWILLILAGLTIIIVPQLRKDLTKISRCVILLIVVLILVSAITAIKLYYGISVIDTSDPISAITTIFNAFHLVFVWCIFTLLYVIRAVSDINKNKDKIISRIDEIGSDAFSNELKAELDAFLENEKAQKEQAKADKKQAKAEKKQEKKEKRDIEN